MIPIYFPFTYLSGPVAAAIQACLGPLVVYQPSGRCVPESLRQLEKAGRVDIRLPEQSEEEKLDRIRKAYSRWAAIHQGNRLDYLKARGAAVPFFEEMSTAQIKADIKKDAAPPAPDPLFNARLFLQIAQDFDAQNDELRRQLLLTNQAERDLYRHLKGQDEPNSRERLKAKMIAGPVREEYMTFERLTAWGTLFLHDRRLHESKKKFFMVTPSRAVLEILQEHSAGIRQVLCVKNIPLESRQELSDLEWRENLSGQLTALGEKADARIEPVMYATGGENGPKATLSVHAAAETPFQFFLRLSNRAGPAPDREHPEGGRHRTLWGLIEVE